MYSASKSRIWHQNTTLPSPTIRSFVKTGLFPKELLYTVFPSLTFTTPSPTSWPPPPLIFYPTLQKLFSVVILTLTTGCGEASTHSSGRSLVEALDVHDLVVLNTTTPTHFSLTGRNAWSLIDLVLVSSSYASLCTCTVTSEVLGSDHSVVLTSVNANTTPEDHGFPKWNFSKADWQKFSAACDQTLLLSPCHWAMPTASLKLMFAKLLWKLVHNPRSLLKSLFHGGTSGATLLWKRNKHAFNRMKRTWLLSDIIIFKRCRARDRRVILEAKSSSWQQFCTLLTSNTNLSKVWKVIKSFSSHRCSYFIPTLHAQGISAKNNTNPTCLQTSSLYPAVV